MIHELKNQYPAVKIIVPSCFDQVPSDRLHTTVAANLCCTTPKFSDGRTATCIWANLTVACATCFRPFKFAAPPHGPWRSGLEHGRGQSNQVAPKTVKANSFLSRATLGTTFRRKPRLYSPKKNTARCLPNKLVLHKSRAKPGRVTSISCES